MSNPKRFPLRSYLNILNFRVAMALRTSKIFNYPIVAYVEPTSFCNLRCPSCPTGMKLNVRERVSISFERFCEIIDELSPYLMILYFYNWGEPFLHKDSIKMIRYACQKGIKVRASSNMSLKLSDEQAIELVKSGLYSLKIGLDGIDQETYEHYRRGGNFNLVVSNIKKIVKFKTQENSRTPILSVSYHIFKHNEQTIKDAEKLAKNIGIDYFTVASSFLPPEDYNIQIEAPHNKSFNMFDKLKGSFVPERRCSWLYGAVVHNPNGTVSPCCGVSYEEYDFGSWPRGKDICSVMNDAKYIMARRVTKQNNKKYAFKVDDGMGFTRLEFDPLSEVICTRCPVPYQWGRIKKDFSFIVNWLYEDYRGARFKEKVYIALCYFLMGVPFLFNGLRKLISKKG